LGSEPPVKYGEDKKALPQQRHRSFAPDGVCRFPLSRRAAPRRSLRYL
jgi:hypothetical protein